MAFSAVKLAGVRFASLPQHKCKIKMFVFLFVFKDEGVKVGISV